MGGVAKSVSNAVSSVGKTVTTAFTNPSKLTLKDVANVAAPVLAAGSGGGFLSGLSSFGSTVAGKLGLTGLSGVGGTAKGILPTIGTDAAGLFGGAGKAASSLNSELTNFTHYTGSALLGSKLSSQISLNNLKSLFGGGGSSPGSPAAAGAGGSSFPNISLSRLKGFASNLLPGGITLPQAALATTPGAAAAAATPIIETAAGTPAYQAAGFGAGSGSSSSTIMIVLAVGALAAMLLFNHKKRR